MFTFEFVPNTDCNLGCYFCFAKNYNTHRITTDDFIKSIKLVEKIANDRIFLKIYGGEVLLHTKSIIEYFKALDKYIGERGRAFKGLDCTIISNGTVMTDEFIDCINTLKNFYVSVSFSMEVDEDTHNKIRHFKGTDVGSYDIVSSNIDKYRHARKMKRGYIQTVLSPELLSNVDKYISFMEKNKERYLFNFVPMFDDTFKDVDRSIVDNITKLYDYYIDSFKKNDCAHIGIFQAERSITNLLSPFDCLTHCQAGVGQITLVSNGDLYPCSKNYYKSQYDLAYGNIKDDLESLENSFNEQKNMYQSLIEHDSECKKCQATHKFGCTGDCMAEKNDYESKHMEHVCYYNIRLGIESKRLWKELKTLDNFLDRMRNVQTKIYKEFHEELMKRIVTYNID